VPYFEPDFGSFFFREGFQIHFPARAEPDVEFPEAAQQGFGILIVSGPEGAGFAGDGGHDICVIETAKEFSFNNKIRQ
jgi:hypothetical protein